MFEPSVTEDLTRSAFINPSVNEIKFEANGRLFSALVEGPDDGVLVVCLHGFPDNNLSFRYQAVALANQGYRVIRPLLPGYETSSLRPENNYTMDSVSDDLIALILSIKYKHSYDRPIHLIGHDWGAISGFATMAKRPELFCSFTSLTIPYNLSLSNILLKSPGYLFKQAWYIELFQLRGIAEYLLEKEHWRFINQLIASWSPNWRIPDETLESIKATLASPGVKSAALSYYRSLFKMNKQAALSRKLLNQDVHVPTLMIRGEQDGCIPFSLWQSINPSSFKSGYELKTVNAGHFLHQEAPVVTNQLLVEWISRHC